MRDCIRAYAPGSTSNLGPGFDCLGVAFTGKGDTVTVVRSPTPGIRVVAVSDPRIPTTADRNTAALAAAAVTGGLRDVGVEIVIDKGLPLSGGMGGSAASAVAAAVAVNELLGLGRSRRELFAAALEAEAALSGRHADNVAPSLFGGAVLVLGEGDLPRVVAVHVHGDVALVLVTPSYGVETARARSVLPAAVPRADAVKQAAALGGLVLGLERGDFALVAEAMRDHIAEPYRTPLYPGYAEARAAGLAAGSAGIVVSGAGPTVVAVTRKGRESEVGDAMTGAYRSAGFDATAHLAEVDVTGARVLA